MVFQKPTPFPMSIYENIAFGVKLYERPSRGEMDERVEWALRQAALWDEAKDKLKQSGTQPFRRPAAAPVHRARGRGQARSAAAGRTDLGARPDLDREDRGIDLNELKADYTIAIVTHNMQQAARVSDFTAYMYLGELIEFDDHRPDLHQSRQERKPRTTSPAASVNERKSSMTQEHSNKLRRRMEGIRSRVLSMGGMVE